MFDPKNKQHRNRLFREIDEASREQKRFRTGVVDAIREYAGTRYAEANGYSNSGEMYGKETINNVLFQAADIMTQTLVAQNPQVLMTTQFEELVPFAYRFERAVNQLAEVIQLRKTLRLALLDAFFSMGMVKVYNADGGNVIFDQNVNIDSGQPFAERISRDDYVYQPATEWDRVGWIQHSYSVTRRGLKDSRFDQKVAKSLTPSEATEYDRDGAELAANITRSETAGQYRDSYRLREIYMPFDGKSDDSHLVVTFGEGSSTPLAVHDYEYSGYGPYHRIGFSDMVDNVEPIAPAMNLMPLQELINSSLYKLAQQSRRSRSIPYYTSQGEQDATRIKNAADGTWTRVDSKDSVGVLNLEGPDQQLWAFMGSLENTFNVLAGNPKARAGLDDGSGTVGGDKIIQSNLGELESKRQGRVAEWTEAIMTHLGLHLWKDQFKEIPMSATTDDGDRYDITWLPDYREGKFVQYNCQVEPYSMRYKSPEQRAQELDDTVMRVVMPMMQSVQEQGGSFDIQEYLTQRSELMNQPRMKRLVKFGAPPIIPRPGPSSGGTEGNKMAPVTERHHVRHNVPSTSQGEQLQQQQQLMSQGSQQPEVT